MRAQTADTRTLSDFSDEELNRYILTHLELAGVDLSLLPEEDEAAPADRVRVLRSARAFLRNTVAALTTFRIEGDGALPELYPVLRAPVRSDPLDVR